MTLSGGPDGLDQAAGGQIGKQSRGTRPGGTRAARPVIAGRAQHLLQRPTLHSPVHPLKCFLIASRRPFVTWLKLHSKEI